MVESPVKKQPRIRMTNVENLVLDYLIERSLGFKTSVIIVEILLLLLSTIARTTYSVLWMLPFLHSV